MIGEKVTFGYNGDILISKIMFPYISIVESRNELFYYYQVVAYFFLVSSPCNYSSLTSRCFLYCNIVIYRTINKKHYVTKQ